MIASGQLPAEHRQTIHDALLSRHRHQHQRRNEGVKGLPMIRSLADIGHRNSERKFDNRGCYATTTFLAIIFFLLNLIF